MTEYDELRLKREYDTLASSLKAELDKLAGEIDRLRAERDALATAEDEGLKPYSRS